MAHAEQALEILASVQPCGTQAFSALETLVGQRLIERSRGRRTVELTEAGRVLLGHAEAIESRLRAAEAAEAAPGTRNGQVSTARRRGRT